MDSEYQKARKLALSGSMDGFEQLRNKFGITTRELARFGVTTDCHGQVLLSTPEQQEKFGKALDQLRIVTGGAA